MEKSPFLMGKSTMSMAMFNSYVSLPEGSTFRTHGRLCVNLGDALILRKDKFIWGSPWHHPLLVTSKRFSNSQQHT